MKPPPTDPFALQARVMSALCDDLFDMGAGKQRGFARTDALRSVLIAMAEDREPVEGRKGGIADSDHAG